MKKIKILLVLSAIWVSSFSQNDFYSITQLKDTLTKYPNVFEAFSKLDINKISIEEFRQDSFLMSKSYDLFNLQEFRDFVVIRNYKDEIFNYIKYPFRKKILIEDFISIKKYSQKQKDSILNKIFSDSNLVKIYLDSSVNYKYDQFAKDMQKYNWKTTDKNYILFHSKLMTQRSYDTIRAYYDRYYKNSLAFYEPVLIALINMGDPEVRAKYDSLFEDKIRLKSFGNDDLDCLTKFTEGYRYYKLSKLLFIDDILVYDYSDSPPIKINEYIVKYYFPFYKNKSFKENIKMKDSMLGINYMIYDNSCWCIKYKYISSFEEFSKYFLDYALYMQKKEQEMYDKIKYKTEK